MSTTNGNRNGLTVKSAKELTPPVNPVEAIRKAAALGLMGALHEKDVADVYAKLKEMALAGDKKAMEMFFKLTLGDGKQSTPAVQDNNATNRLAETLQDLVDEIRITKAEAARRENDPLLNRSAARITDMHDDE